MRVRVSHVTRCFGAFRAVDDVSFSLESGCLAALLGPSGAGKSTVLRILAGLESCDAGRVWFGDEDATQVHARDRAVGFVFQHYALFRHLSVERNVAFGLEVRGVRRKVAVKRAHELLELVGLAGFGPRYPQQLSGGQRQRVALARALAPAPRLLLLDEPFSAVDAKVREDLRLWLLRLHEELGVTSVFVTHDQDEAMSVADQVLVINEGRLEQMGSPEEILDEPCCEFVARFVGEVNVFAAVARRGEARAGALRAKVAEGAPEGPVQLVVRAGDLRLHSEGAAVATVERVAVLGDRVRVHGTADGAGAFVAHVPRAEANRLGFRAGSRVSLAVQAARVFPGGGEVAGARVAP